MVLGVCFGDISQHARVVVAESCLLGPANRVGSFLCAWKKESLPNEPMLVVRSPLVLLWKSFVVFGRSAFFQLVWH